MLDAILSLGLNCKNLSAPNYQELRIVCGLPVLLLRDGLCVKWDSHRSIPMILVGPLSHSGLHSPDIRKPVGTP